MPASGKQDVRASHEEACVVHEHWSVTGVCSFVHPCLQLHNRPAQFPVNMHGEVNFETLEAGIRLTTSPSFHWSLV